MTTKPDAHNDAPSSSDDALVRASTPVAPPAGRMARAATASAIGLEMAQPNADLETAAPTRPKETLEEVLQEVLENDEVSTLGEADSETTREAADTDDVEEVEADAPETIRERVAQVIDVSRERLRSISETVRERAAERVYFSSEEEKYTHLHSMVRSFTSGMLVTLDDDMPRGRPMMIADTEGRGDDMTLWFVTRRDSAKVDELASDSHVSVLLQDSARYLSLSGRARVILDTDKLTSLWRPSWKLWFGEGPEAANGVLLRVQVREAEFWDQSGLLGLRLVFNAARALITGERITDFTSDSDDRHHARVSFAASA